MVLEVTGNHWTTSILIGNRHFTFFLVRSKERSQNNETSCLVGLSGGGMVQAGEWASGSPAHVTPASTHESESESRERSRRALGHGQGRPLRWITASFRLATRQSAPSFVLTDRAPRRFCVRVFFHQGFISTVESLRW